MVTRKHYHIRDTHLNCHIYRHLAHAQFPSCAYHAHNRKEEEKKTQSKKKRKKHGCTASKTFIMKLSWHNERGDRERNRTHNFRVVSKMH